MKPSDLSDPSGVPGPEPEISASGGSRVPHQLSESDVREFQQVYREMFPRMYGLARKSFDRAAAFDVAQETFAGMWDRWDKIPAEMRTVAFFLRAVQRRVVNEQRRQRRNDAATVRWSPRIERNVADQSVRADMLEWEVAEVIDRTIAAMPYGRRDVWNAVRIDGMSYDDAAVALGVTKHTIRRQMWLAIRQMRKAFHRAGYTAETFAESRDAIAGADGNDSPTSKEV